LSLVVGLWSLAKPGRISLPYDNTVTLRDGNLLVGVEAISETSLRPVRTFDSYIRLDPIEIGSHLRAGINFFFSDANPIENGSREVVIL
jgi:hypothetical protein